MMMVAYRGTYGDGTEYWDCYIRRSFRFRAHSIAEIAIEAAARGIAWKEVL